MQCKDSDKVMEVLRREFTDPGGKIPTASQRCAAMSSWLRFCSGSSVEIHEEPIITQRFQGMRDLVQQTMKIFKRVVDSYEQKRQRRKDDENQYLTPGEAVLIFRNSMAELERRYLGIFTDPAAFGALPNSERLLRAVDWRQYLYLAMVPFPAQRTGVYRNIQLAELARAEEVVVDGERHRRIGVIHNKTEYKYGDATILIPVRLYTLLTFFVEWIRPHLLRPDESGNTDVLPRLDCYGTGPLGTRRPDWLSEQLISKIRGNKIRIQSVVWSNAMRARGLLDGVTEVDLAEMRGQSTQVVEKVYRGMEATKRKTMTQFKIRRLLQEEGEAENREKGLEYLQTDEAVMERQEDDLSQAGCSWWMADAEPPSPAEPPAKRRKAKPPKTGRRRWTAEELSKVREFAADLGKTWSDVIGFQATCLPNRTAGATWVKVVEMRAAAAKEQI